jgi:hypothetical protein
VGSVDMRSLGSQRISIVRQDAVPWLGPTAMAALVAASLLALLGLPPVDLHGPLHRMGIMDPFCGGTRAARFLMVGDWASAWHYNPGIFALSAILGLGLVRWILGRVTGHWLHLVVGRKVVVFVALVGLVALEVNQQLKVDLLVQR